MAIFPVDAGQTPVRIGVDGLADGLDAKP
eukprot:SAG31_NODE_26364_length_443_cov_1.601744_1_plen_28_part_01